LIFAFETLIFMPELTTKSKKAAKVEKEKAIAAKPERYFEAVGRRKASVARVRLYTKRSGFEVNGRKLEEYFPILGLQRKIESPLLKMKITDKLGATIKVYGGGLTGQAEAIRLGIARALTKFNPEFRKRLKRFGLLKRDARVVERKKYGLKKARRAPQWKKR